jgi:A/G-specific adenine glycosylase
VHIGNLIVTWYGQYGRDMAWRETRDPYRIWIAEVILQQTRIAQGEQYFYRFVDRFPNVHALAKASQDEVLKYWEGLGYYSRARNLHAAAKQIVEESGGHMPDHYSEWLRFKGIGPYTARAIGSFAFGNATGVIDGNVMRVMSRFLGDFSPIDSAATRSKHQTTIDAWVQGVDSRAFNHGIMDIGSTVCTPTQPACMICPLIEGCIARKAGTIHLLPHKQKQLARKVRHFDFYLVRNPQGEIAVRRRPDKGIWGGLWEIPNRETTATAWQERISAWQGVYLGEMKHVFTHFDMQIHVYEAVESAVPEDAVEQFISIEKISIFAFSKAVLKIFEKWLNMD